MSITNFLAAIRRDERLNLDLAEHKYIHQVEPKYMKLDISDRIRDVLKKRGVELFYSHQVEAIDLIRQGENVIVMTPTASGKSLIYNIPVLESTLFRI